MSLGQSGAVGATIVADPAEWPDPASPKRRTRRAFAASVGLLPFGAYTTLFLVVPAAAVVIEAFRSPSGHWTWANIATATHGVYLHGFVMSIELSLIT
jgi:putative spermidine/putrescine transport system permease protein